MRNFILLFVTLTAFAANSVLTRMALKGIEYGASSTPVGFTLIRLLSGAIMLAVIFGPKKSFAPRYWRQAFALFIYALLFSIAYVMIDAGVGALILFGAVQITMLVGGYLAGERLTLRQIGGACLAVIGLIVLLTPTTGAAPMLSAGLIMVISGISWGLYSLMGRSSFNPGAQTAQNFMKAAALAVVFCVPYLLLRPEPLPSFLTIILAIISGAVTSGLGYVLWYSVLKTLSASRAAISQLSVPALAAIGGVLFLSEPLTPTFIIASTLILGGVGAAVIQLRQN